MDVGITVERRPSQAIEAVGLVGPLSYTVMECTVQMIGGCWDYSREEAKPGH